MGTHPRGAAHLRRQARIAPAKRSITAPPAHPSKLHRRFPSRHAHQTPAERNSSSGQHPSASSSSIRKTPGLRMTSRSTQQTLTLNFGVRLHHPRCCTRCRERSVQLCQPGLHRQAFQLPPLQQLLRRRSRPRFGFAYSPFRKTTPSPSSAELIRHLLRRARA